MSNNIYDEAIAEAALIRESAEERAKEKLIQAMTPQIKNLVEKSILESSMTEESSDDCSHCKGEGCDHCQSDSDKAEQAEQVEECGSSYMESFNLGMSDKELVEESSKEFLKGIITEGVRKTALFSDLSDIRKRVESLNRALVLIENKAPSKPIFNRFNRILNDLNEDINNFKSNEILKTDDNLIKEYIDIKKELSNMSRRRRRLEESLEELFESYLFEEEETDEESDAADDSSEADSDSDPVDDDDFKLDFSDIEDDDSDDEDADEEEDAEEDAGSEEDTVEVPKASLETIADSMESIEDELAKLLSDEMMSDDDSDEEEDSEEDADSEDDSEEADDMEEGYDSLDEMDIDEMDMSEDDMIEIDEGVLRREISRMRKIREGEAKDMASHFGGGKLDKEMFVDVDDRVLNALADEIGDAPVPKSASGKSLTESNVRRKNRMLEGKLKEYKSSLEGMKQQLSEMNLFNAKLLYANKLMQNKQLSETAQRRIVEALDEAKTIEAAKKVYEKLSETVERTTARKSISENANRRVLSSSSSTVSSSQPAKGSADLDRWARLAGLKQ